jgi:hypothetical protein
MKTLFSHSLFFILISSLWGQTFDRIERNAGFGQLLNNQGVATADYDQDGDLDLFIVAKNDFASIQPNTWSKLMRNNNDGTFTDVTIGAGFDNLYNFDEEDPGEKFGVKMGASWGDHDKDGFPDLLLTNYKRIQLFRNQGDGSFLEVTASAGLPVQDDCYYTTALWWDLNKDGFLDLFVAKWGGCSSNRYFENKGDGTFRERTSDLGLGGNASKSWMALPLDVNQDGRWDLYLSNEGAPNELLVQQADGSFSEQGEAYGLAFEGDEKGMCLGDYDNDGTMDIFIANLSQNRLATSTGNTYSDLAMERGVANSYWSWAGQFADLDLDGDEDLFVANGYQDDFIFFPLLKSNFLFQNQVVEGQDSFQNISSPAQVDTFSNSMGINLFDYDVDGDLDVFVSNMDDTPLFYENKTISREGNDSLAWTGIRLQGSRSNRDGLGSRVTLWAQGKAQHRLYTGASLHAQSLTGLHVGLGKASKIDSLEVAWDWGLVEKYYNLPVNQYLLIRENDSLQVLNLQNEKVFGCTNPNGCNYNPNATVDDGSCQFLPPVPINGNNQSGYLKTETYSCPERAGSRYFWQVTEGEILDGQGTSNVSIQWHLADSGAISVTEINSCASEPTPLPVDFSLANMDDKHSIARLWNEALLFSIRRDFARPTVHARNLFHSSVAMYDAWALYHETARPYLIGNEVHGFSSSFAGFSPNKNPAEALRETISFAMYRLLRHRFSASPAFLEASLMYDQLMSELGYDPQNASTDYSGGDPAALGNFIAQTVIDYGLQDGATERQDYGNAYYRPVNEAMITNQAGPQDLQDPNRWQPLSFETFIDQSGNLIEGSTPDFLSPEWGNVAPFSLNDNSKSSYERDGNTYHVFYEPERPPHLDTLALSQESAQYQWNFSLVSIWAAHLTPADSVMWDISPAGIGNIALEDLPTAYADYPDFYNTLEGGDIGQGWDMNPVTGAPYPPQIVPRGDYTRVLAEFWADGPDSETPPGHWFTILNKVNDHPQLEKRLGGQGPTLDKLEWDVKSYFILGGTMHDAAIAAWSIKGWFDYIRPISAIRYMAERGQSSDPNLPSYDVAGIPLREGLVELVEEGDELAGINGQHVGKIKLYTWRGHRYISDPEVEAAGVGWILAENWMPYQRISFVTPPFAGFVSGHSTYSRAAAEAMTLLTGDAYFPGGVGEFVAYKNEFLVFEEGPSVDVVLQWATYRDASDQCSLSRIWGGIHPPADDIPGRLVGEKIGKQAYAFAIPYFFPQETGVPLVVFPNPAQSGGEISLAPTREDMTFQVFDLQGRKVGVQSVRFDSRTQQTQIRISNPAPGMYFISSGDRSWKLMIR